MTEPAASPVLQPVTIGDLCLKNRIVMAPLTRSRSDDAGVPPDFAADYYAQRAQAGLIISEATNISAQARGYALTPGIWSDAQVEAWRPIVDAVHRRDGLIFLQLWHTGRISHPDLHGGALPVAPSAIKPVGQAFTNDGMKDHVTPRALETDEIPPIVEDYRRAAINAKAAGFDGVEVHSANNYLLELFSLGRPFIANPDLVDRLRTGAPLADAPKQYWYGGGSVGYSDWPRMTERAVA